MKKKMSLLREIEIHLRRLQLTATSWPQLCVVTALCGWKDDNLKHFHRLDNVMKHPGDRANEFSVYISTSTLGVVLKPDSCDVLRSPTFVGYWTTDPSPPQRHAV